MMFTRYARSTAIAMALLGAGGLVATPALAKDKKVEAPKASYSKGFMAVYSPLNTNLTAATPDVAAAIATIPALLAAVETEDDRNAAGNIILLMGQKNSDQALQAQGLDLMIASGKVTPDKLGIVYFSSGQLAYLAKNYAKSREMLQKAVAAGYTQSDIDGLIAETYFNESKYAEGLAHLGKVIDARKAAGQTVDENWIRRGLAIAYQNAIKDETGKYAMMYVDAYPSATSWGDAVAVLLNTGGYQSAEVLDLLRLARRTGSFRDAAVLREYIESADYRRLPAEVVGVIDEGIAKNILTANDGYIKDTRALAQSRVSVDQRDLPSLLRDARAAGASSTAIMAAGDTLLSMGKAAEAEEMYAKALTVSGIDTPTVLTRLGIAQVDQGKYADAQATFTKVQGARQAIAALWQVYARQKATPVAAPAPAAAPAPVTQ